MGVSECLASPQGWWFHLRRCGSVGTLVAATVLRASMRPSMRQHGHPIIASFEPGEDWFYDYEKQAMIKGVELLPPHSHPTNQPTPGPAGRVPADWESLLH